MWPFSRRYESKGTITQAELRAEFARWDCFHIPLDPSNTILSQKDAEWFAWKYGCRARPPVKSIYDCEDYALDTFSAWREGARKEGIHPAPAFGILWLKCVGGFSGATHMSNYFRHEGGLARYEAQQSDWRGFETVEKVFARMG